MKSNSMQNNHKPLLPKTGFTGLKENWKSDLSSGFIVFLIALPLCLGISMASGFPPISGILTACVGGLFVTFFTNSQLTIKGPAAGLIAIALAAVQDLGGGNAIHGYHLALACIVIAGLLQIIFGWLKSGILGDFFPSAAVHGMLAAIGIIIIAKQLHVVLGVKPEAKETIDLILEIPKSLGSMNPEIFIIGFVSLIILFGLPLFKNKYVKMIPAPLLVILIAIPLGHYFDLEHTHKYLFRNHTYTLNDKFLVTLPANLKDAIQFPDFVGLGAVPLTALKYILMFALVGTLESLLTAKAIDMLDPFKRKTNLNKDILAVGLGNSISGFLGGLPMISEVVRSSANKNNGAKTNWSNFFHGIFLLLFVILLPNLIHQIPLAALAAILVYTGFRLASPKEFYKTYKIGIEQLLIFVTTIIAVLFTDLLVGIGIGILLKLIIHLYNGLPLKSIFKPIINISTKDNVNFLVDVGHSAVFSNFIVLKKHLMALPRKKNVQIDFTDAKLVDSTVMEGLHNFGEEYISEGGTFYMTGLHNHKKLSKHPMAAYKKGK